MLKKTKLPSFAGVAFLLALFVTLPWLPIGSQDAEGQRNLRVRSIRTAAAARQPIRDYTVHVVATEDDYRALMPRFPSPSSDLILVMEPGQDEILALFRSELDAQRAAQALPPARLDDRRAQP